MYSIAYIFTKALFWQFQSSIGSIAACISSLYMRFLYYLLRPFLFVLGCVNSGSNTKQRHCRASDKSNSSLRHNLISLLQCVCVRLSVYVNVRPRDIPQCNGAYSCLWSQCACFFLRINVLSYPAGEEKISYCHHVREKDGEKRKREGKDGWWGQW